MFMFLFPDYCAYCVVWGHSARQNNERNCTQAESGVEKEKVGAQTALPEVDSWDTMLFELSRGVVGA